ADVLPPSGQEDDALLAVDFVHRFGGERVVGVGDQVDVQPVGRDVALEEVVERHGGRRVTVGRLPARTRLAGRVDGGVDGSWPEVRAGVRAGAVVEARVVAVVR